MPTAAGESGPPERLAVIEAQLAAGGRVRIDALAERLGVSEMTIRRDLDELEALGVARRVRGGAVAVGPEQFAQRHRHNAKAKARIAEKLLALMPDAGAVAFDASSTVHRVATLLDGARDLLVVTNGLDTFQALQARPGVTATLTGGALEPRTGSLVGPLATRCADDVLFELFVCSGAAVDAAVGSSEASLAEAEVKRALARSSRRVVLAVDHTKLGTRAQARTFRLAELDAMVTDLAPGDARLDDYRSEVALH